jgi:hypothetical protein
VGSQGFAKNETEEGGAVCDFRWEVGLVYLAFGEGGEPGAEGLTVLRSVEAEEVWGSVFVAVGWLEEVGDGDDGGVSAPAYVEVGFAGGYRGSDQAFEGMGVAGLEETEVGGFGHGTAERKGG